MPEFNVLGGEIRELGKLVMTAKRRVRVGDDHRRGHPRTQTTSALTKNITGDTLVSVRSRAATSSA
jgi:hypothetical protein